MTQGPLKVPFCLSLAALALAGRSLAAAPAGGTAVPVRGATIQVTFGLKDAQPAAWDGKLAVSSGKLLDLRIDGKGGPKNQVAGDSWKLTSRQVMNRKLKKPVMVPAVLFATLDAPPTAKVTISTPRGEAAFLLGELALGTPMPLLGGQVEAARVPFSAALTESATDDDLPAAAADAQGNVWAVYVAYTNGPKLDPAALHKTRKFDSLVTRGHGDQVHLLKFDGKAWGAPMNVTEGGLDCWRPAVAVDGQGIVWVVWSQNVAGNWDLYVRGFDTRPGKWQPPRRLTTAPGADIYPVAVRDPKTGRVVVVWQGWRNGSFDILLDAVHEGAQPAEKPLAATGANEWCPAAAFDGKGNLHVAYDTYEKGSYDVRLASVLPAGEIKTVDVAASDLYEARPSVAVDPQDRVWVAYEEGAANWGKDDGGKWTGPKGERLYIWREARVRCVAGGVVRQAPGEVPIEAVQAAYPRGSLPPKRRVSLPRVCFDSAGCLWLLYRRHATQAGAGERWVTCATHLGAGGWSAAVPLANSANILDNRPALVPLSEGLLVVHSTDGRAAGTQGAKRNDLYCSVLQSAGPAGPPEPVARPAAPAKAAPVHPNEPADLARIRAHRAEIGGRTYQLLRGEFHRHTELTAHQDMDGTLEEMWRYGLDVASMDWIGNGDHDNGYGVEYLWWMVQKQTDIFHHAPRFCPMFTYERSRSYPSGHRNAMFARRGIRPLPQAPGGKEQVFGTPERGSPDVQAFYAYLRHFDGICASHTSGTGMGTDWRDNDPGVEPVVEIFQGCRQSYEYEGAPATAKDPKDSIGGYQPAGFIWNALKKGYKLGFESSSDHYSTHISYAIVYAERPGREAILDGFKKRHCYAANDNIILDVRCGERMMGDLFELAGKPTLTVKAVGTLPIARVSIVRGVGSDVPRYVYDAEPGTQQVELSWTDQSPVVGKTSYYYVRVEQQRPEGGFGSLAWASPMWITVRP